MAADLPSPPESFSSRKFKILDQLAVPDADYTDLSPKGSVDVGIRELIDELNVIPGLVTTSSCAGRISVFLEGRKDNLPAVAVSEDADERQTQAGVGGKGGGGTWLLVSHDPVEAPNAEDVEGMLRLYGIDAMTHEMDDMTSRRLIHFKFEPMLLLKCAMQAGFRESGSLNITSTASEAATPMVAVRTMGLNFESLVGYETADGRKVAVVPAAYLKTLLDIGNTRFQENAKRIARFRDALKEAIAGPPAKLGDGGEWEDATARKARKRAEGLQRKADMAAAAAATTSDKTNKTDVDEPAAALDTASIFKNE